MKTLYVIRHAKSSWEHDSLADIDRPLNDRGKKDAPRMGKRLKEKDIHPDLMISSPAARALSTCQRIAEVLGYNTDLIRTDRKLYHAGEQEILQVVRGVSDKHDVVMIFGHNPGLTDFVNMMNEEKEVTGNVPTCGVAAFEIPVDSWADVGFETGKLVFYDYPKSRSDS